MVCFDPPQTAEPLYRWFQKHRPHFFLSDNSGLIGSFVSGVLGSGSIGLIPLVATNPELVAVPIVADMVFNVIGYIITQDTPTPIETSPQFASFAAFQQAVSEQLEINAGANDSTVDCSGDTRIKAPDSIDMIAQNEQYYWNNYVITAMCHSGAHMLRYTAGGDQYDASGYVGYHEYTASAFGRFVNPVWEFTLTNKVGP